MPIASTLSVLEYALHDLDLEDDKKVPTFYWDTSHVRNALLGRAYYYDIEVNSAKSSTTFIESRFKSENALIYSLASAGWYGRLQLLQPHQAELVKLINRGFNIGAIDVPVGNIPQFLKDVNLSGLDHQEIDKLDTLPKERVATIVSMQAGQAPQLFKVLQGLRHRSWKEHLSYWLTNGVFQPETAPYNYREILKTPLFEELYIAFEKQRSDKDENNLIDAIAMCQLKQKIREFSLGHTKECPLFLASPLYHRILGHGKLSSHFSYDFMNKQFSALRTEDYFVLRATIKPYALHDNTDRHKQTERFADLRRDLQEVRLSGQFNEESSPHNLASKGKRISDLVRRVQRYSFLEEVWLPYAAETEMVEAIRAHIDSSKAMENSSVFHGELDGQVATFLHEIKDVSKQVEEYRRLLKDLHSAVHQKLDRFDQHRPEANLSVLSGLFRFGFEWSIQSRVDELFRAIISDEAAIRSKGMLELMKMIPSDEDASREEEAVIAACVLWALGMYRRVKNVLEKITPTHLSTRVLQAATGLQLNEVSTCLRVIQELENEFSEEADDAVKMATALAYLNFNLRKCYLNSAVRRSPKELREYLQKSVFFARAAREQSTDIERIAYATNQELYYMISDHDGYSREEIMSLAEKLSQFDGNLDVWQYRYDDTLAIYYEWLSIGAIDKRDKRRWLDLAVKKAELAMRACGGEDPEIERHLQRIMNARERLKR